MESRPNIRQAVAVLLLSVLIIALSAPAIASGQQPAVATSQAPAADPDSLELQWKQAREEANGPRVPDHMPMRIIALFVGGAWLWYELVRQRLIPRKRRLRRS